MKMDERPANPDVHDSADQAILAALEAENSGLRRMIVELIEQNQRLREQLQRAEGHRNAAADNAPLARVDPQAA